MSEGLNQCQLLGNLGADPEWRMTNSGGVLQLRIATTETYLDRNRQRQEVTEWHTIVVWGKRGEALSRILTKGSKIMVVGAIRTNSWEANDGTKRYRTQIVARNIILCGGGSGAPRPQNQDPPGGYYDQPQGYTPPGGDDDDIPF